LIHFYKRMMTSPLTLYVLGSLAIAARCQEMRSTWPPQFNPGEECLAYDGSKVPDCTEFIDPVLKEPYYHPHSFNCSRFWECGPTYETCLFECAHCNNEAMDNPLCKGQQALTFDPVIQWPFGPVCNWPNTIDCDNDNVPCDCLPWQSCVNGVCSPQCTLDVHCPVGYVCDDCNWCVPGSPCNGDDSACLQGVCDIPWPYTTCEYCGADDACLPGCSSDSNCPSGYVCDTGSHLCTPELGCNNNDANCLQGQCDEPVNWPYTTCEYCDDVGGVDCLPGCSDDSVCPPDYPVCGHGGSDHRCGCNDDGDCSGLGSGYICDVGSHHCKSGCAVDADCPNEMCDIENSPYTTCTYCGDNGVCVPGCTSDDYCPTGFECVNYLCEVKPAGYILLKEIKVFAGSGAYTMDLVGNHGTVNPPTCTTNQLFGSGSFTGDAQLGNVLQHGCNLAPLNNEVSGGQVHGGESWNGATACFDWNEDDYFVWECEISGGYLVNCNNDSGNTEC